MREGQISTKQLDRYGIDISAEQQQFLQPTATVNLASPSHFFAISEHEIGSFVGPARRRDFEVGTLQAGQKRCER